jgi:hypothetical protein
VSAAQKIPSRIVLSRGLVVVVALVAAGMIAVAVWLVTRSGPAEYATPIEAVLAACPVDPSTHPEDLSIRPPNTGPYQSVITVSGFAVVAWTDKDAPHAEQSALVRHLSDGKWRVAACRPPATLHR